MQKVRWEFQSNQLFYKINLIFDNTISELFTLG